MTTKEQIAALAAQSNISRRMVEATIGHKLDEEEYAVFLKAKTVAELRRAQKKARGPMSVAERVRKHVSAKNDIGEIPRVKHPRVRERCKYDLELFGRLYMPELLKHRAPKELKEELIIPVQNAILRGGKIGAEVYRGGGKTTWVQHIAEVWAAVFGHRRFLVGISATGSLSKKNLKNLKRVLRNSRRLKDDFPEIIYPIIHLGGISQRAASQTYQGRATEIEWGSDQIRFADLRDENGERLGPGCGAIIAAVGIGGAVRGANEGGQRPDYVILDDPQTKKIAKSPKMVQDVIEYISNDALLLAGHDRVISAFVTITPQRFGDVAHELASDRHPEWDFRVIPFVRRFPLHWDRLAQDYAEKFHEDNFKKDQSHEGARRWYRENKARFEGIKVVDAEQFDAKEEEDAVQHILSIYATDPRAFLAEIQMQVADVNTQIDINVDVVTSKTNGFPRLTMPPGVSKGLVAFSDINTQANKGMSWVVVAFGKKRTAAVVAYGRYPESGPLVPVNASEDVKAREIARGITAVAKLVASLDIRDASGAKREVSVMGFDRGFEPATVMRSLLNIQQKVPLPFRLISTRGVGPAFRVRKDELFATSDHVYGTRTALGDYLTVVSAYWREKMQSSFLETPLMPGSLSLYGKSPAAHAQFANEICAERLMRRYFDKNGNIRWDWAKVAEDEHFGDALTQSFAIASYYRLYAALPSVVDAAVPRETIANPLFDPNENAAIVENASSVEEVDADADDAANAPEAERPAQAAQAKERVRTLSTDVYRLKKVAEARRRKFKARYRK